MNKKISKILYYCFILFMLILADKIISLVKPNDQNCLINNVLEQENNDLKKEITELSNLEYHDYNYVLGKITIKNLYNTNTYFINTEKEIKDNSPVINSAGFIGIYQNHYLMPTANLNLSIKINNNNGTLNNQLITIKHDNYYISEPIYTSGLTNIPGDLLIGYIKTITSQDNNITDEITVTYLDNNTNYVGILTNYA